MPPDGKTISRRNNLIWYLCKNLYKRYGNHETENCERKKASGENQYKKVILLTHKHKNCVMTKKR